MTKQLLVLVACGLGSLGCSYALAQEKTAPTAAPAAAPDPTMGVTFQDVQVGQGAQAKAGSCVVVHLVGTIKGGEEIENTRASEQPIGIVLRPGPGGVPIAGLTPGISGMKVGGKRTVMIPAAAAFGDKESKFGSKTIPANSDLHFEIELVDIVVIEDLQVGTGAECKPGTIVNAHYRGTFKSSGEEFDSSYSRGSPATFPLANVIKGWTEGVPGMKVGGKRKLTIPYQFAYGEKGRAPKIPEKADLVFEIELVAALDIIDEKVGDGPEVPPVERGKPAPIVNVHYRGTLKSDGKEFDSSYSRGEPIEFALTQVIPGWTYGIPGMKVGGKRKLIIPWQFAYGEQGAGGLIGPKADLVFEVELLGVKSGT
ncbi:MAG: FKBP-type peptidyl-prolyl cis-trans isomerase [Phycisphaerales bacterium]